MQQSGTLLTVGFLGQSTVRVNAFQLALQTISVAAYSTYTCVQCFNGRPGCTASQVTVVTHKCFAGQALLLEADFSRPLYTAKFQQAILNCTHLPC